MLYSPKYEKYFTGASGYVAYILANTVIKMHIAHTQIYVVGTQVKEALQGLFTRPLLRLESVRSRHRECVSMSSKGVATVRENKRSVDTFYLCLKHVCHIE